MLLIARSFAIYKGPFVRAILLLKFEQIAPLGIWFAGRLAALIQNEAEKLAADVVVPLHRQRESERGHKPGSADFHAPGEAAAASRQGTSPRAHARSARQAHS